MTKTEQMLVEIKGDLEVVQTRQLAQNERLNALAHLPERVAKLEANLEAHRIRSELVGEHSKEFRWVWWSFLIAAVGGSVVLLGQAVLGG